MEKRIFLGLGHAYVLLPTPQSIKDTNIVQCRCGMGGMIYQMIFICLETHCQHQRCANCSMSDDAVGPAK